MPDLAIEPERHGLLVLHVRVRALQHPSRASASMPFLCRGRSRRTALPCPTLMRLAAHLDVAGKMPLTDFCNRHFRLEHPTPIARLPSPQPFSRGDRLLPVIPEPFFSKRPKSSWRSTASDHLSAIRPRVKQRLTAPPQLQPDPSPFSPLKERRNWALPGGRGHLGPAFSATPEAEDQTSDAPVAPRDRPGKTRSLTESQEPLPPPSRQQERLSRPRAPFIDTCVAHIRRHRPPPIPQLCRRGPASGARSPLRCSRTKRLDPPRLRGLFARGREDRAPLVDFCNQNDR